MRSIRREESGLAYAAITALAAMVLIAVVWNLLSPTLEREVFQRTENELIADNNFEELRPTYDMIRWIWDYWPLIMIFATVLYLFISSQRPQSPYG